VLEGTHLGELPRVDRCVEALRALTERLEIDCGLVLCGCAELAHQEPGAEPPFLWGRTLSSSLGSARRSHAAVNAW
jgi:hypothetical protein